MATWIDSNGHEQSDFECSCGIQGDCHESAVPQLCNCDASPPVLKWMEDTGVIKDKNLLPILGFRYGFMRGNATITIGNLVCEGISNST